MTNGYNPLKVGTRKVTPEDLANRERTVKAFYDAIGDNYDDLHRGRFCDEILEYFIFHFLPRPPQRVLDLGGGIGRFAIPLAAAGYDVTLYDISDKMLAAAQKIAEEQKVQLKYKNGSVVNLGTIASESFDSVICMNSVLDYCEDYARAMAEVHRVLQQGGTFIGSVNNLFAYATSQELKEGNLEVFVESLQTGDRYIQWGDASHGHVTHDFTQEELYQALRRASFRNIRTLGVFNLLGKYFHDKDILQRLDKDRFFQLQLKFARKPEYVNNSDDFFFVCEK